MPNSKINFFNHNNIMQYIDLVILWLIESFFVYNIWLLEYERILIGKIINRFEFCKIAMPFKFSNLFFYEGFGSYDGLLRM